MDSPDNIKVELNDSRKKNVNIKGIESINSGIKIIRAKEESLDSESTCSSVSIKKTKKVLRKKSDHRGYHEPSKTDYNSFVNPKKVKNEYPESDGSEYSDESDESGNESGGSGYSDSGESFSEKKEKDNWEEKQKAKQDLLIKIQALEKKGFEFSKKFNMTSNYEDMMFEYEKVKHFIDSQAAIKFSRRCLMACVTGLEFVNKKFDPFSIKLDGWSENVMESVDDYDNIFEKLHEKYASKAQIAPEIELLLTLGGSAFMFHLTNTLLKGPMMNLNPVAQNNPNFMANMMGAMSQGMKDAAKPPNFNSPGDYRSPQDQYLPKPVDTRGVRKEMRGPNMDPGLFSGTPLATNHPNQINSMPPPPGPIKYSQGPMNMNNHDIRKYYDENPIDDDDRFSMASSDSSFSSVSVKNVKIKQKGKNNGLELNII